RPSPIPPHTPKPTKSSSIEPQQQQRDFIAAQNERARRFGRRRRPFYLTPDIRAPSIGTRKIPGTTPLRSRNEL
ncbi:hypothetical protein B0T24DRAFT_670436, partial [Lasiosphaeria ovina]